MKGLKEVEEADKMGSSFASEIFEMIRMVAACGAEGRITKRYQELVEESRRRCLLLSPIVAVQHAPGKFNSWQLRSVKLTSIAFFAVHA